MYHPLDKKRVCFTGRLSLGTRAEVNSMLLRVGGTPSNNIDYSVSYLVVGDRPGARKLHDALLKNIERINEDQFRTLLNAPMTEKKLDIDYTISIEEEQRKPSRDVKADFL